MVGLLVVGGGIFAIVALTGDDEPATPAAPASDSAEGGDDSSGSDGGGSSGLPEAEAIPDDLESEFQDLAEDCFGGDLAGCDELWVNTPVGSVAEEYGGTCGGRITYEGPSQCEERLG